MEIGDKVWLFDINRRVYKKDGVSFTAPIFSEYFYQATIDGETSKSWLVGGKKFSKKYPAGIYTNEQKSDAIWDNSIRQTIVSKVRYCSIQQLKQISRILDLKD